MRNVELSFWKYLTPTMLKCIGMWNMEWEFPIPIPIPEFWNVECGNPHSNSHSIFQNSGMGIGIVLLRISHSNHAKVHWNVEYGMWNSTFQSLFQNFGMWNVELLFWGHLTPTMLKCIGMWNMECGNPHSNSHSRILECGVWNVEIHIPIPIPEF